MADPTSYSPVTLRRSATVGLITGLLFALWAAIVFVTQGSSPFALVHTSFIRVSLTYVTVGVFAGTTIGALWPLARGAVGCYLIAVPAAAAIAAGVLLMHADAWVAWDLSTWGLYGVLFVVGTLVIGNQINVRRIESLRSSNAAQAIDERVV